MDSTDDGSARLQSAPANAPVRALPPPAAFVVRFVAVVAGYYLTARLGLLIPYLGTHISLVWLPTGVAVAALRRWGPAMAPAVFLAAMATNAFGAGPGWLCVVIGLGNAVGPSLSAFLLSRLDFDNRLLRQRDVLAFFMAVLPGMAVTSLNGIGWLRMAGAPDVAQPFQAWLSWLAGDVVGALLAGVPLIAWYRHDAAQAFGGRRGAGNVLLQALVLACGLAAFSPWTASDSALVFPLLALPFFLLALLALRGGIIASSTGVLLLSMAAAWGTARGFGPFAARDPRAGSLALWSYITAQGGTSLLICGLGMALRASQRQLKAVTDNVPALFAYVDRTQTYRFANAHFQKMMGTAPASVVGRTMREFLGDAAHAELRPHIEAALRGERQKFERTGWKENADRHFAAEYVPDVGADGRVDGFFIMLLDITERHRAQLALSRSETMVRTIADQMPGLIARMDRDYRYTFANANYVRWFSLDSSPVGRTVAEVFGAAVFEGVRGRIDQALAGEDVVFDLTNTLAGGADYMQVHYVPDRDADGRVIGMYGLVTDRTEQQRSRERIEASERQLRAVTDNLPVLITYVDADEILRFMNGTFRDWLGVDLHKSLDRPLAEVVGAEHYASRRAYLHAALAGERVEFEVVSNTLAGRRNLQTVYVPDVRADGSVRGVFTLATDVTALKDVERELQRLARIDTLTGLANRRQFDELLDQALARSRRGHQPLALIFLDIDRFKTINDTHGHAVGDAVLKEFAARLQANLRANDLAARLSGDEFVVILDGLASLDEATGVADKLLHAIRQPVLLAERALDVTASMGLAWLDGQSEVGAKEVMVRADRALYRAKDEGRDGLRVA